MKTCEDCIHYDVCLGAFGDWLPKICDSFKDASKFIELPCSIGDTVTKLVRVNFGPTGETFEAEVQGIYVEFTTKTKDGAYGSFQIKDIGHSVFLTKEEAETNRDKWLAFYNSHEVLEV